MLTKNGKDAVARIVGNSTFGRYSKISSEIKYNMFTSDGWQVSAFGYKRVGELPSPGAKGRGQFVSTRNNIILSVIGSTVVLIDSNLVANIVGTISSSQGIVYFAQNLTNQICIVDGQSNAPYIFNVSERSLTKQTPSDGFVPNYVDYHDTYFLFGNKNFTSNGSKFLIYEYATESTIAFFAEGALQTKSDFALAVKRIPSGGANVLVFGKTVTEVQTNVGGQLVYQRVSSMSVDYGTASVASISANGNHVVWLGQNEHSKPCIMSFSASEGFRKLTQIDAEGKPRTDGIFYLIENTRYPEKSFSTMSVLDGHEIYMLTFPDEADDFTICYDFNADGFFFLTDWDMHYFPAVDIVYFNKNTYFCSFKNSSIYQIGSQFTTYDENITLLDDEKNYVIPRVAISDTIRYENSDNFITNVVKMIAENGNNIQFNALTLEPKVTFITNEDGDILTSETGIPLVTEDSEATITYVPKIELAYSIDGGKTWSMYVTYSYNFDAFRQSMVQWEGLGGSNDIRLKLRFWTKSSVVVNNPVAEVKI